MCRSIRAAFILPENKFLIDYRYCLYVFLFKDYLNILSYYCIIIAKYQEDARNHISGLTEEHNKLLNDHNNLKRMQTSSNFGNNTNQELLELRGAYEQLKTTAERKFTQLLRTHQTLLAKQVEDHSGDVRTIFLKGLSSGIGCD